MPSSPRTVARVQPPPTFTRRVAGLDLAITVYSPALVTATDPASDGRFVANVAILPRSGTAVVHHNWLYRDTFGADRFDPAGRGARGELIRAALEVRDAPSLD